MYAFIFCFFFRPKDASEILACELEKSSMKGASAGNNDDMFSGFSLSQTSNNKSQTTVASSNAMQLNKPKEQLK